MRSTTLASKVNENTAAAVMLTAPAIVVASRMEMSVESILKTSDSGRAVFYRPTLVLA